MKRPKNLMVAGAMAMFMVAQNVDAKVVTPNTGSLLSGKRVLIVEATNWNSSHTTPKANALASLKAIKTEAKIASFTIMDNVADMTFNALNAYDIVVFNYVFNTQKAVGTKFETAFKQWLAAGNKGYIGYHTSGANDPSEWPWYRDSVTSMAYHKHDDAAQSGRIFMSRDPSIKSEPILAGMDTSFTGDDEWYSFDVDGNAASTWKQCKVIYYMDESKSVLTKPMGVHPMAWYREDALKNRFFYSAFIHSDVGAKSDFFHSVILRALEYVAGYSTTSITSQGNSILTGKNMSYATNSRTLKVELEGSYRLSIWSTSGKMLFLTEGKGQKTYSPTVLEKSGFYIVRLEAKDVSLSQRIMIY